MQILCYNSYVEIFIIDKNEIENISKETLVQFKKKDISNQNKLNEHCFAYYMTDKILKDFYNISESNIEFINNKPYLKNRNTKQYIAICFSDSECGIDIEIIKNRDYESISKRMNFVSENLTDFYYKWTSYEAEYKLGQEFRSKVQLNYEDNIITAISSNYTETFDIYIQNGKTFSKLEN